MPAHGHGLPTRPRVARALGNGLYEIEGVGFNMGGWWEIGIPGADQLVGRGVYLKLPVEIPRSFRDRNAIVTGEAGDCATAAKQLEKAGWRVNIVTRERYVRGVGRQCRRMVGTEVVCAAGGDYLEAVVLRRIRSGRLEAFNVSALFIL